MIRCTHTREFFGVTLQCVREWDNHGTCHAYHATSKQTHQMLGIRHVPTQREAQLELCLDPNSPPEGFVSL